MNLHPKVLEIWGRQLWVIRWHKWEFKFSPEDLCDNFHLTGNKMCVSSNYRREYLFFTYIYFPCILHSWEFENIHGLWGGGERKREEERVLCFLFSTILTGTRVACGTKPTSPKCLKWSVVWHTCRPTPSNPTLVEVSLQKYVSCPYRDGTAEWVVWLSPWRFTHVTRMHTFGPSSR